VTKTFCILLSCIYRYSKNLASAKDFGIRKGIISGLGMAFFFFIMFVAYALAFWYGGKLIREEQYTGGRMLIVSSVLLKFYSFNMHVR